MKVPYQISHFRRKLDSHWRRHRYSLSSNNSWRV
jgi:hypothetical protein